MQERENGGSEQLTHPPQRRVPLLTQQPCSFFNYSEMAIDFRLGMRQEMRGKSYVHLENTQYKN